MKKYLFILLLLPNLLFAQHGVNAVFKQVQNNDVWHVYGGFEDSSTTIDLTVSTWVQITNAWGTLFQSGEADGFSISGDTMTVANSGDYAGHLSITMSGSNNDELYMRIFNVTQNDSTYKIGYTGIGATSFANVSMPVYIEVNAGDQLVLQLLNTDSNDDAIVRSAAFYISYIHD